VDDHAEALLAALARGRPGESYALGGGAERRNLDVVRAVCALLDELQPSSPHRPHADLIRFVEDRPGHDLRYAIDSAKAARALGWRPKVPFEDGLRRTVAWYLANEPWRKAALARGYAGERLGLAR
jgi:dTDP-glucose 4,6-dehydratase